MSPSSHVGRSRVAERGQAASTPRVQARLAVNLPAGLHRKLKIRAAQRGISIRNYILMLLREDGLA